MFDMNMWCNENKIPFKVTSTVTTIDEDRRLGRTSITHRTARAFDLSVRGWDHLEIRDFMNYFSRKYHSYAAVNTSGEPALIVYHNSGHGDHFHIQIHSRYKKDNHIASN